MTRQFKTVRASIKAAPASVDAAQGYFDALVSVFDSEDLVGDIVEKGAFDKAIKAWQDSGDPVPVVWSHQWDDPMAHIGWVDPKNLRVTDRGLEVKDAVIDLDTDYAKQVHKLLVNRRVKEFSFAYDAKDYAYDQRDVRHLKELDFFEIGPTLKGAHPDTELIGAKNDGGEGEGDPPPTPDPDPEGGTPPAEPDPQSNDPDNSGDGEGSASGDSEGLVLGEERLDDKSHDVVMAYALRHGKVVADETIEALGEARAAVDAVLASLEEGKSTDGAQQPAGDDAAGTDETEHRLRLLSL